MPEEEKIPTRVSVGYPLPWVNSVYDYMNLPTGGQVFLERVAG